MSVALSVTGTYAARGNQKRPAAPAAWLNELGQWVVRTFEPLLTYEPTVETEGEEPTLLLTMHPCAAPIEVTAPDRGELQLTAQTSSVGPGYHQFVCDMMDAMAAEFGVTWGPEVEGESDDETGYFYRRDRAELESSMLAWLGALAGTFVAPGGMLDEGTRAHGDIPPAMAMGLGVIFLHDGGVTTPMGPRDRAWFEAVAADPTRGIDFFAWWDEGETARVLLGRALALMWTDVRWVQAGSEEDFSVQRDVVELLADAYEQDSSLEYPWREWAELLELVEWEGEPREEIEARAAKVDRRRPPIGYRRGDVLMQLPGGWTARVPGSFSMSFDEEEGELVASDGDRTVRFSGMGTEVGGPPMEELTAESLPELGVEQEEPLEPWVRGRLRARGAIGLIEDEGRRSWMLASTLVTDGNVGLVTIFFDDSKERDWAMGVWRSISHLREGTGDRG